MTKGKVFCSTLFFILILCGQSMAGSQTPGRSGEAKIDIGTRSVGYGTVGQAKELLATIKKHPNKSVYQISYRTSADTLVFGCDFAKDTITRVHYYKDGRRIREAWQGFILDRLKNGADGGSLNDTPRGKSQGTFESF